MGIMGSVLGAIVSKVIAGFFLGFFLGPIGWIIVFLLPRDQESKEVSAAQKTEPRKRTDRPERNLESNAYRFWLGKTYNIQKNELFEKYEYDNDLFGTLEEALLGADQKDREKLLNIINHDVERIERLITDYSQMLKDEASLSREKMFKIDLDKIIRNVAEDFKQNAVSLSKKIEIEIINRKNEKKPFYILGIESRIEQVIANLLDNAISFSQNNHKILVEINETKKEFLIIFKDEGPGFKEKNIDNIFKRFYSNRPQNFGEHSGLGLNIVKNIIELHKGKIKAMNRIDKKGAQIEVFLPKYS